MNPTVYKLTSRLNAIMKHNKHLNTDFLVNCLTKDVHFSTAEFDPENSEKGLEIS